MLSSMYDLKWVQKNKMHLRLNKDKLSQKTALKHLDKLLIIVNQLKGAAKKGMFSSGPATKGGGG